VLTPEPEACERVWPTAGKLVFRSQNDLSGTFDGTQTASYNIWVMNGDGTGLLPLTQNTAAGLDLNPPHISADGSRVTFFGFMDVSGAWNGTAPPNPNIFVVNTDGTGLTAVTQETAGVAGNSQFPDILPDGSRVVFQSNRTLANTLPNQAPNGAFNIWIADADGGNLTALTQNTTAGMQSFVPTFSPDGAQIVFHSLSDVTSPFPWNGTATGSRNIWIMNADGSGRTPITRNTLAGRDSRIPNFSPGGGLISFHSTTNLTVGVWDGAATGSNNIWVVKSDGTGLTPITRNTAAGRDSIAGYISYDGTKIVFHSYMGLDAETGTWNGTATGSANIWIANVDGTGLKALTRNTIAGLESTAGVFSNDGKKIYFTTNMPLAGGWDGTGVNSDNVWSVNIDGTGLQPLTGNTALGLDSVIANFAQPSHCR
jgi:Tol biopolymer transport system component